MTFLEAAASVLAEFGNGGPLHTRDITRIALEKKLVNTIGQTPEASMAAQLYLSVKKDAELGRPAKFIHVGRGLFALATQVQRHGLESEIGSLNVRTKAALLERLKTMTANAFERLIAQLLTSVGYEDVQVTGRSGDQGIDAVGRLSLDGITNVNTAIQAKRWSGNVSGRVVREMRGSLQVDQRGLIVTTADFTRDAVEESKAAGKQPISLVDGGKLVELMVKHGIAVTRKIVEVLQLNLEALDQIEEDAQSGPTRGKAASIWPMPGGKDQYYESLMRFLRQISVARPNRDDMIAWVKKSFPQVTSELVIDGYINLLRYLKLVEYEGETLACTDLGVDFLSAPSPVRLLDIMRANILGVEEIIKILGGGPTAKDTLHKQLISELELNWETQTQTSYRLSWLEVLNAVESKNGRFQLVPPSSQVNKTDHSAQAERAASAT